METQKPVDWKSGWDELNRRIEYLTFNGTHEDANGNIVNNTQELQTLMTIRDQIRKGIQPLVDMDIEGYNGNWDPAFDPPVDSLVKESKQGEKFLDGLQRALDVAGFVPGFGEVADGLNAVLSLLRGNYVDVGLSAAAMLPIAGWGATLGKIAKNAIKGADTIETAAKYSDEFVETGEQVSKELEDQIDQDWYHPEEPDILGDELKASTEGAGELPKAEDIIFGSEAKSSQKLQRQMDARGWTNDSVKGTVSDYYTTRSATNRATGNPATVYYNKDGSYIIVDNVTNEVVQVSNKFDSNWAPDSSIINPYLP